MNGGDFLRISESRSERETVLGGIFFAANSLEKRIDRYLAADDLTAKQWLLCVVAESFGADGVILGNAATLLGCSRQNAKQIALRLETSGYLSIERDCDDARALRLRLTQKARRYWAANAVRNQSFLDSLFEGVDDRDAAAAARVLLRLHDTAEM